MYTVNVDIFAQLHFRASIPRRHIHEVRFSQLINSICSIMIIIFTHIKFSRIYKACVKCAKICTARKILRLMKTTLSNGAHSNFYRCITCYET